MIYLGGLQGISEEVVESAKIDGCNWWVLTFKIKLPMIFNYLQVAMMLDKTDHYIKLDALTML